MGIPGGKYMKRLIFVLTVLALSLATTSTALGAVLYSAPPSPAYFGWFSVVGDQQIVQDFSPDADGTVDTIRVYGFCDVYPAENLAVSFVLEFFEDNAGVPSTSSFYTTTTAAIAGVDTGLVAAYGSEIYKYEFGVSGPFLSSSSTYWFGAKANGSCGDGEYWAWSNSQTDLSGDFWYRNSDSDPWTSDASFGVQGDNQAFELEGEGSAAYTDVCIYSYDTDEFCGIDLATGDWVYSDCSGSNAFGNAETLSNSDKGLKAEDNDVDDFLFKLDGSYDKEEGKCAHKLNGDPVFKFGGLLVEAADTECTCP